MDLTKLQGALVVVATAIFEILVLYNVSLPISLDNILLLIQVVFAILIPIIGGGTALYIYQRKNILAGKAALASKR